MKDTFIVPLLHPHATSPVASPTMSEYEYMSQLDTGVTQHQLPNDLRQCFEVIENSILAGHLKLREGLRKRYDEQYPLVRSLADVFVANVGFILFDPHSPLICGLQSHILWGYADYVLYLERALEQANDMISTSDSTKRPKNKNADEWLKVCTFLRKLEHDAQGRGETGLALSLSKPFQRLLKYPLLFQKVLFYTDHSTFEYDTTLRMAAEVENILRSIEDEKIQKEARDKTRDVLARIEGMDKVKLLAVPKSSRVLVEERKLELSDAVGTTKAARGKTSSECLSDLLQTSEGGVEGKNDMWLVVFNDVILRCQQTGTTFLPLGSAHTPKANSLHEYPITGRRNSTARPRNLYKFIEASFRPFSQAFSRCESNFDGVPFRSKGAPLAKVSDLVKAWCRRFQNVTRRST